MASPEVDTHQSVSARISNAMVKVSKQHTGRGPTKARTLVGHDFISCVMEDTLTTAERTLAAGGDAETVLMTRHKLQDQMREAAIAVVEEITGRKVIAFMSDNHIDPDMAVESFVLEPRPESEDGHHPSEA